MSFGPKRIIELLTDKQNKIRYNIHIEGYEIITPKNSVYNWDVCCDGIFGEITFGAWGKKKEYIHTEHPYSYNPNKKNFGTVVALLRVKCPIVAKEWIEENKHYVRKH